MARRVRRDAPVNRARVDIIDIENSTVKGLLVELRTEVRERDEHARTSLARLHERLDEFGKEVNERLADVQAADALETGREQGRQMAQTMTWKVAAYSVTATIALGGLAVGVLQLVL
jgi:transposase